MTRDIFAEVNEGLDALSEHRQGRTALRSYPVELEKAQPVAVLDLPEAERPGYDVASVGGSVS